MPKKIKPKTGEITVSPTGDVVIGVPVAEAIVVINPEQTNQTKEQSRETSSQ